MEIKNLWLGNLGYGLLLVALILLGGCNEDDITSIPGNVPEVELSGIFLVNDQIQLSAKFTGSLPKEILEHGFIIGDKVPLKMESGFLISRAGISTNDFSLTLDAPKIESLVVYVIKAFIKTKSGYYFSNEANFTYDGKSLTFHSDILVSSEIYFGDTVTILDSGIKPFDGIEVFFNKRHASVVELQTGALKFIVPDSIVFDPILAKNDLFEIELRLKGKSISSQRRIKFKEPVFFDSTSDPIDFNELIKIRGEYLHDPFLKVYYSQDFIQGNEFPKVSSEENELVLEPKADFKELDPELTFVIRGKTYKRKDLVKFNPTEVEKNQKLKFEIGNANSSFTISVKNLNPYGSIVPVISPDFFDWKIIELTNNQIKIGLNGFKNLIPQEFNVRLKSGEKLLDSDVIVEVISPVKSITIWENSPGSSTNIGGTFFYTDDDGFWELNPNNWGKKKLWNRPESYQGYPAKGFFFQELVGKRIFLGDPGGTMRISSYNLDSKILEDYGEIGLFTIPFRVYSIGEKLRIDYGFKVYNPERSELNKSVLEFDIEPKAWNTLKVGERNEINSDKFRSIPKIFSFQNELYCLSWNPDNLNDDLIYLFRLMENKLDWANLGSLTGEFSEKIIVDVLPLENRIFFNTKENWYELDIEQNSTRKIEELSSFAYRPYDLLFEGSGFVYENKFYIWKQLKETGYILLEFDPTYF